MSKALALKYRPSRFEDLIGQDTISQTLSLALDTGRLGHAYLFSGIRGSGKTSTARIFSKALNCESGPTSKPCGECGSCMSAMGAKHIDIIEMDAASSRKIDDIRELIEHTKFKPSIGRFKIFIIDEVHMLTKEAFNALLKTLEEPPEYIKFILATTDPLKLPPTILSRTQHFRFKKIARSDVVNHLITVLNAENIEYEPEALDILARTGGGSLRDTLTLLDQAVIFSKGSLESASVADMLGIIDPDSIERIFTTIFKRDTAQLGGIVEMLEGYEAETVVDELSAFLKERMLEGDARFGIVVIDRFFRILAEAKHLLSINSESSFVLTLTLFKMVEALKVKDVDVMIEELEGKMMHQGAQAQASQAPAPREPQPAVSAPVPEAPPMLAEEQPVPEMEVDEQSRYAAFLAKINDRSFELGECFSHSVRFVKFEDGTLLLESRAKERCKELLRLSYGVIKQFVREVYGINTIIKVQKWEGDGEEQAEEAPVKKNSEIEPLPPESEEENPAASMIEDVELSSGCVQNNLGIKKAKVIDKEELDNNPTIQTIKELFSPTKIIVKSKA